MNLSYITKFNNAIQRRDVQAALFLILLGFIVFIRLQVYLKVCLVYIDSDQPFMWAGAMDYAKGIFNEPRFYGQNYNTFFEGLIAVPLIWLGLPVYQSLPIATQFIFLFPFIFTATYLFLKRNVFAASLVLCILLCLPSAFDIMTSIPRGFVTGIFFSSFFVVSICNPNNLIFLSLNFLMLVIGYFVNPNCLLVSVPFIFYLFLFHYKHQPFYILSLVMLVLFLALYYFIDGFYIRHPDYVVYGLEHRFSVKYFIQNIQHLDQAFGYISFFTEGNYWLFLLSLIVLSYFLFNQNKKAFFAFTLFVLIILFSFFSEKSRDGVNWPWYAYSRIFICAPAILYLFTNVLNIKKNILIIVVSIFFSVFKIISFETNVNRLTNEKLWCGVHLVKLESTLEAIQLYKNQCQKNKVDFLLISNGFWLNTYLDYGGPAIDKDFPQTYETRAERRYWVRNNLNDKVFERFIFISAIYDFEKKAKGAFQIKKLDDYGLYLVEKNQLTTKIFIDLANHIELN